MNAQIPEIQFIERKPLPSRRQGTTVMIAHQHPFGVRHYTVTFGFDHVSDVREIFCWPEKSGAELDALISDACIVISHALQRGASVKELAQAFGQLRPEGAPDGEWPPASPLGTILRVGAFIERLEKRERSS